MLQKEPSLITPAKGQAAISSALAVALMQGPEQSSHSA